MSKPLARHTHTHTHRLTEVMQAELQCDTLGAAVGKAVLPDDALVDAGSTAVFGTKTCGSTHRASALGGSPPSKPTPAVKAEQGTQLVQVAARGSTDEAAVSTTDGKRQRSQPSEPETDGMCARSGNCGSKVCKANLNRARKVGGAVCRILPMNGARFCEHCQREAFGCTSPRAPFFTGIGRWCSKHSRFFADVDKVADPSKYYLTGSGWQHHSPDATVSKRFMCSYGFMLHWGCPPDLLNGADVFARFLAPRSGSSDSAANDSSKRVPHPEGLVVALIVHFLKWPTAVNEFLRVLAARHPRPWTAASFACAVMETIQFCDGHRWPEMFKGMNVAKHINAPNGVAVFGRCVGILATCDAEEEVSHGGGSPAAKVIRLKLAGSAAAKPAGSAAVRQRLKRKSAGSSAANREIASPAKGEVRLGPFGSRYRVDPKATAILTEKFDDIIRHAAEFSEMWPMSPEDPLPFLRAMGDFYMKARNILCTSGEKVSNARCGRQRFIRWAVASLDRFEPRCPTESHTITLKQCCWREKIM